MAKNKVKTDAVNGVLVEFTENKNGVTIKKCCASCKHHEPHDNEGPRRDCMKHLVIVGDKVQPKVVDKSDCCGDWAISDAINSIKLRP